MNEYRPSIAANLQFPDCPGCGNDLAGLDRAIFCPGCGRQLQFKITRSERLTSLLRAAFQTITQTITLGRFDRPAQPPGEMNLDRTPIMTGYGKALFALGWRYERGSSKNLREARRCYRKAARLGNLEAALRLGKK